MIKKAALLILLAIVFNGVLYAFIWAHHTLVTGLNPFLGMVFLVVALSILVPVVIFFSRRMARRSLRFTPAMAFLFGLFTLLVGDLINTGYKRTTTLDILVHDTYFVIAHLHVTAFFALVFLAFAAVYFYFSEKKGRMLNAPMGYIHFIFTLVAVYFICWPYNYADPMVMPQRYMDYSDSVTVYAFSGVNHYATEAMILFVCGQAVFVVNLILFSRAR